MTRVLIVAEHASANFGGEAALPLHYFRVLRRLGHEVWLITHARTRAELEALFPGENRIHYIEDSGFHRFMWGISRRLPARIAYFTTGFASRISVQLEQRRIARALVGKHAIDVVHQPIPVSPREPSLMCGLGAPVVIGPMNGGMDYPPAFRRATLTEALLVAVGRSASEILNWVFPGKRHASVLLVANARTRAALPRVARHRVVELVENGVDFEVFRVAPEPVDSAPVFDGTTFIYLGRLVKWKRVDLLLRAFAVASKKAKIRLEVAGSGDEEPQLRAIARKLGVLGDGAAAGGVTFAGWLSPRECARRLAASDVLVLPSLIECGGAVVLEAMAMGKPVIATAWGGPVDYLDESCGILVPPDSEHALVHGFADAMVRLAFAPGERERVGRNGRAKAQRDYDWDTKVARMLGIYAQAIGAASPEAQA